MKKIEHTLLDDSGSSAHRECSFWTSPSEVPFANPKLVGSQSQKTGVIDRVWALLFVTTLFDEKWFRSLSIHTIEFVSFVTDMFKWANWKREKNNRNSTMKNPGSFPDFAYEFERIAIIWETRIFKKKKGTKDYYPLLCSLVLWVLDRFLQPTSLLNRYEGQQSTFGFSFWVFTLLETNSIITWVIVLRQMVCPLSCRVLYRLISFPWIESSFITSDINNSVLGYTNTK